MIRKLTIFLISSGKDRYGFPRFPISACGLASPLSRAAWSPFLASSAAFPWISREQTLADPPSAQYRFYRAGESDGQTWSGSPCSSNLGDGSAVSTPAGLCRMVARVLSFCAPSRIAAGSAHAATRTRGQPSGATLPAADTSDGSRENPSTMDGRRGALLPIAAGFRLRGSQARWGAVSCRGGMGEGSHRGVRMESHSWKRRRVWTASSPKTGPKWVCRGLVDFSTISYGSTRRKIWRSAVCAPWSSHARSVVARAVPKAPIHVWICLVSLALGPLKVSTLSSSAWPSSLTNLPYVKREQYPCRDVLDILPLYRRAGILCLTPRASCCNGNCLPDSRHNRPYVTSTGLECSSSSGRELLCCLAVPLVECARFLFAV